MKKILFLLLFVFLLPLPSFGMHIMEGYLPLGWSLFWYVVSAPFVVMSFFAVKKILKSNPKQRVLLGISGAFIFILSALKLPSVTGSSSHLTGSSLGAIALGPRYIPLLGLIVLLFQVLLLAHGGITTLGANVFSMSIVGPYVAYFIYKSGIKANINSSLVIFLSAFFGDISTYVTTAFQLAVAHPDPTGGVFASAVKFLSIFAVTQLPLAVVEGIITVAVISFLNQQKLSLQTVNKS